MHARGIDAYATLVRWLREDEKPTAIANVQDAAATFERRLEALRISTARARTVLAEMGDEDDTDTLGLALMRLVQQRLVDVLIEQPLDLEKVKLDALARTVAQLAQSGMRQKLWQLELRLRVEAAAASIKRQGKDAGLREETLARIESEVLGLSR